MTLKEFTDLMCMSVEMSIELRDTDNQEICTCKSGSKGIKPYEDYNVNEWFTVPNNGRVVVTISMSHTSVKHVDFSKKILYYDKETIRYYDDGEFEKNKAEVKAILEKYKEPADYRWDGNNRHYYITYSMYDKGALSCNTTVDEMSESVTFFQSEDDLMKALQEAGVENVKKYLFEIKE